MGAFLVCGTFLGVCMILIGINDLRRNMRKPDPRLIENAYVRDVHAQAGNRDYPHKLANGEIRWYRVSYGDALDL